MRTDRINQSKHIKQKINIVDAVVYIVILALAVTVFLIFDPFDWIQTPQPLKQEKTVVYVVEINDLSEEYVETIKVGDGVNVNNVVRGTIVEVNVGLSYYWELSEDKSHMVLHRNPDSNNVFVAIEFKCDYEDGLGYFLRDEQLFVGKSIQIKFNRFDAVMGECVSITEKE